MQLKPEDVLHLSKLSRIDISEDEVASTLKQLNRVFDLIEQMQATDTSGIAPMTHPQNDQLRMREDKVTEPERREDYQQAAPRVSQGLYLVPKVIE